MTIEELRRCGRHGCKCQPEFQISWLKFGVNFELVCEDHLIETVRSEASEGRMVHIAGLFHV